VWATNFPSSRYYLPPAKEKLKAPQIVDNEWPQIEKVLLVEDSDKLWQGRFSPPNGGRISQGFGYKTIVNGKASGAHRGTDIATYEGQTVLAPNRGKVVMAQNFQAFGGTMVLDHGQGIHTLYFHLSSFEAEVGTVVEKGDIIAKSGNTGVSSGPHLHWGMSVHNLRVDPMQWVKYEI
ncbi:MAG: M23 family metallopeptidase, partial [bacterium]